LSCLLVESQLIEIKEEEGEEEKEESKNNKKEGVLSEETFIYVEIVKLLLFQYC
jgi:hypothetical protein